MGCRVCLAPLGAALLLCLASAVSALDRPPRNYVLSYCGTPLPTDPAPWPDRVSIFIQSWRRWSPASVIVIVTNNLECAAIARNLGAAAHCVPPSSPSTPATQSVFVERHLAVAEYLRAHMHAMHLVCFLDLRDTVAQLDVFRLRLVAALHAARSVAISDVGPPAPRHPRARMTTIASNRFNAGWVRTCFGIHTLQRVQRHPILNSGFLLGHPAAVEAFSRKVVEVYLAVCPNVTVGGIDQGVANVIVHGMTEAERGFPVQVLLNGEVVFNVVMVATYQMRDSFHLTHDSRIRGIGAASSALRAYPVVHQYDLTRRVPDYTAVLQGMYPYQNASGLELKPRPKKSWLTVIA